VTQADGDCTLSTDDSVVVADLRTGAGGLAGTRSGGTADTAPLGRVTVTFAGTADAAVAQLVTDNDTFAWVAEG
jgi:hypothetical protein